MLKLTLILLLTSIQGLWAQDDSFLFGKVGSRVTTTAWENTPPDILSNIAVCWQNGDTVDITGNGNNLTGSHTNPGITPNSWNFGTFYQINDLVSYGGITYRSLATDNVGNEPYNDKINWVYHAPQRMGTGLANIPYAFRLNTYDNYFTAPSANEFHYQGENVTFAFWISGTFSYGNIIGKGSEWSISDIEGRIKVAFNSEDIELSETVSPPFENLTHYVFIRDYANDSLIVYVNGSRVATGTNTRQDNNDINEVTVGYSMGDYITDAGLFTFSQIAIYKRKLTDEQVAYLYNSGNGRLLQP